MLRLCRHRPTGAGTAAWLPRQVARHAPLLLPMPARATAIVARARGRSGSSHGHRSGSSSPSWSASSQGWRRRDEGEPDPDTAPASQGDPREPSEQQWNSGSSSYLYGSSSGGGGSSSYNRGVYRGSSPPPADAGAAAPSGGSSRASGASPGPVRSAAVPSFLQALPTLGGARTPLGATLASRLRASARPPAAGRAGSHPTDPDPEGDAPGGAWSWGAGADAGDASASTPVAPPAAADGRQVARVALVALAPVAVWALTWGLTSGLAHVADACMGGMCGVARALFPTLPVRGVTHEDVAVSLIKSMQAGTADDATWTRPGALRGFCVFGGGRAAELQAAGCRLQVACVAAVIE
jgi:hypothetical protein